MATIKKDDEDNLALCFHPDELDQFPFVVGQEVSVTFTGGAIYCFDPGDRQASLVASGLRSIDKHDVVYRDLSKR